MELPDLDFLYQVADQESTEPAKQQTIKPPAVKEERLQRVGVSADGNPALQPVHYDLDNLMEASRRLLRRPAEERLRTGKYTHLSPEEVTWNDN